MNEPSAVEWLYRWFNDNQEATLEEALKAFSEAKTKEETQQRLAYEQGQRSLANWEEFLIGKNIHSVYTWCKDCHSEGVNFPLNDECGNCRSLNTVRYYDKETLDLLFKGPN